MRASTENLTINYYWKHGVGRRPPAWPISMQ